MTWFNVETETVRSLANTLLSVQSTLQSLHGVVDGYAGKLGSDDLVGELDKFVGNWSQGISSISTKTTGLKLIAAGAADAYDQADGSIISAATGN